MSDPIVELADLVTAALNDASLGFTAERAYLPQLKREALTSDIHVLVVPKGETETPHTRNLEQVDFDIYIGVIKKLAIDTDGTFNDAEIDALRDIVKSIKARLREATFAAYRRIRTQNEPLYDPEHLAEYHQFTSILTVTYRSLQ